MAITVIGRLQNETNKQKVFACWWKAPIEGVRQISLGRGFQSFGLTKMVQTKNSTMKSCLEHFQFLCQNPLSIMFSFQHWHYAVSDREWTDQWGSLHFWVGAQFKWTAALFKHVDCFCANVT